MNFNLHGNNSDPITFFDRLAYIYAGNPEFIGYVIESSNNVTEISFNCSPLDKTGQFSSFSLVLFNSSNGKVQNTQNLIDTHKYLEYGEVWFDSHIISNGARNMEVRNLKDSENQSEFENFTYRIKSRRFEDHILISMKGPKKRI